MHEGGESHAASARHNPTDSVTPRSAARLAYWAEVYWADSIGRRNTSSIEVSDGATTALGDSVDGEAADAVSGTANTALETLRAQGYPVLEEDVASRLSPFIREHGDEQWWREYSAQVQAAAEPFEDHYLTSRQRQLISVEQLCLPVQELVSWWLRATAKCRSAPSSNAPASPEPARSSSSA